MKTWNWRARPRGNKPTWWQLFVVALCSLLLGWCGAFLGVMLWEAIK